MLVYNLFALEKRCKMTTFCYNIKAFISETFVMMSSFLTCVGWTLLSLSCVTGVVNNFWWQWDLLGKYCSASWTFSCANTLVTTSQLELWLALFFSVVSVELFWIHHPDRLMMVSKVNLSVPQLLFWPLTWLDLSSSVLELQTSSIVSFLRMSMFL